MTSKRSERWDRARGGDWAERLEGVLKQSSRERESEQFQLTITGHRSGILGCSIQSSASIGNKLISAIMKTRERKRREVAKRRTQASVSSDLWKIIEFNLRKKTLSLAESRTLIFIRMGKFENFLRNIFHVEREVLILIDRKEWLRRWWRWWREEFEVCRVEISSLSRWKIHDTHTRSLSRCY